MTVRSWLQDVFYKKFNKTYRRHPLIRTYICCVRLLGPDYRMSSIKFNRTYRRHPVIRTYICCVWRLGPDYRMSSIKFNRTYRRHPVIRTYICCVWRLGPDYRMSSIKFNRTIFDPDKGFFFCILGRFDVAGAFMLTYFVVLLLARHCLLKNILALHFRILDLKLL